MEIFWDLLGFIGLCNVLSLTYRYWFKIETVQFACFGATKNRTQNLCKSLHINMIELIRISLAYVDCLIQATGRGAKVLIVETDGQTAPLNTEKLKPS